MKIKYIAVDVDGTLLDDHDHYDEQRLVKDITALQQRGITFVIASGNSLDALLTMFKGKVNNFVAENGGRIFVNGQETSDYPHQRPVLKELLRFMVPFRPQICCRFRELAKRTLLTNTLRSRSPFIPIMHTSTS